MFGFTIVWIGQIVSVLASAMSQFGLTIFMFQKTESATALGLMQVFFITPFLLISPVAGVMVDRHNRKMMMMVSDLGAGIATIVILVFQWLGILEFWHLYFASIIYGLGMAFQWPAYSAAITTMVPKEQYGRANGMMSLIEAGPGVIAPLLAGALLPFIGLTGILLFDVATFLLAIGALMLVHVPQPPRTEEGEKGKGSVWKEAAYGFKYIFARPSLLGLQMIFFVGNLFAGIGFTLLAPMVLSRTANDSLMLGSVQTAGAVGGLIGGIIMSAWGGFKRRVHGVLLGWMISGLGMSIVGLVGGLPIWITGIIVTSLVGPLVNASNQAIWQAKVAPDVQGRVFSARRLIAWFTNPISPIIAGTLADFVLEPQMRVTSSLSQTFGWLVGIGPGAGMGLIIFFCGFGGILAGLAGYFIPAIHNAETILLDHDERPKTEAAPA
ncbi:MAG: MFS transporter [Anaerolineales bacterium]|nr:MFS transporter [Anaerolineales bacterium]